MFKRNHAPRGRSTAHKITVTLVVTALATMAVWAFAGDGDGWSGRGPHGGAGMLSRHLNLTDEQKQQVEEIMTSSRAEGKALRQEIGDLRQTIAQSVRENGYQEDQVRIQLESKAPQMVDLMVLRIRTMAQIYALLTPEQQAEADELFERGPRFKRGRGHRHGGGFDDI